MAVEVAGLTAVFEATDREFLAELRRIDRGIAQTTSRGRRQLQTMDSSWKTLRLGALGFRNALTGLLPVMGAAAGTAGLARLTTNALKFGDELTDVSQKVGVTTTELQELRFAASEVGVSTQTLDLALQRFARRVGEAARGGGELSQVLEDYNIAVRNAQGATRSQVDILRDLANVIQDAESEQEQLRIAFKAFDSEGAALVNILKEGEAGLEAFIEKAQELNLVVDADTIAALDRAESAFRRFIDFLKTSAVGTIGELILRFEDARQATDEQLTEAFRRAVEEGRPVADVLREIRDEATAANEVLRDLANREVSRFRAAAAGPEAVPVPIAKPQEPILRRRFAEDERMLREQAGDIQASVRAIELVNEGWEEQNRNLLQAATLRDEALREDRFEQFQAAQEETNRLWREQQQEIRATEREIRRTELAGEQFGRTIGDSFADAALEGDKLSDVLGNLAKLFARQGISSAFGGLFGAIFGAFAGGGGTTARQHGGPLRAGQASIVGEAGPELFIPARGGVVVPNSQLGGGHTFYVDMRNASVEAVAELRRLVNQVNGSIETRAVSAVVSARHRDPGLFT